MREEVLDEGRHVDGLQKQQTIFTLDKLQEEEEEEEEEQQQQQQQQEYRIHKWRTRAGKTGTRHQNKAF